VISQLPTAVGESYNEQTDLPGAIAKMASVYPATYAPGLNNGDRMTRAEFHRVYSEMPESVLAELVGGVVYLASPLRVRHGKQQVYLATVLGNYEACTPGVEAADNTTVMLGDQGEPQPDLYLRILPEFGGQSRTSADDYVDGAPEAIIEIAHSTRAIDLHAKYEDYRRYGVVEYLIACLADEKLRWFDLRNDRELQADGDGIIRVQTFPGLWINSTALFGNNPAGLLATLEQGLATPAHAEFVRHLASRRLQPEG
jgi:Uma2 family endonuclease